MTQTADDIRRLLAQNGAELKRSAMADENIRKAASEELDRINARLSEIKAGKVSLSPALACEYRSLIGKRGKLSLLLSNPVHDSLSGD